MVDPRSTEGPEAVNVTQYGKNLAELYGRYAARAKHVIWATTTPCPAACGGKGRSWQQVNAYNKMAISSLTAAAATAGRELLVDDLWADVMTACNGTHSKPYAACALQQKGNVHFSTSGQQFLGERVSQSIMAALSKP